MYKIDYNSYRSVMSFNRRVRFLVMHYAAENFEKSVLSLTGRSTSVHYLVPDPSEQTYINAGFKDMRIFNLVDESERAWHAGVSQWSGRTNLNDTSIGIEIVNLAIDNGGVFTFPSYNPTQVDAVKELALNILQRYPDISPVNVVGHSDIAPGRKSDPSAAFRALVDKLQRMQFGKSSEKLREKTQRQVREAKERISALQEEMAEVLCEQHDPVLPQPLRQSSARKPLSASLPRETRTLPPTETACPACVGKLSALGCDVSEQLELISSAFKVIETQRPKLACCSCDHIVQAAMSSKPIERSYAGPGLLALINTAKFAEHTPHYRQSEIYSRQGVELSRATLGRWSGAVSELLKPLYDMLRQYVLMPGKVHTDDIPVPVQEPGSGKTRTARLWVYVRDDRNAGSQLPPAVWFAYPPDRKGVHPQRHLAGYGGILQADAYSGYNALYEDGRITEAACMGTHGEKSTMYTSAHPRISPPKR
ncbi:UNVERIFIED_ORG: transposase IS166 family protein [Pantoea agglomerans]|uniref:Transposase IS166 family protein n=1 Tax=Enterobacter agglomerans TaxID=549 RepID=A0ABD6XP87_ENTAG|nr:N-acetyl-anhydromuramyl-L-alanine amidase AmpD/transposase [Pantoea agglomerans]